MTTLTHWAHRHGIPRAALDDLRRILTAEPTDPPVTAVAPRSEAAVQQAVRLEASRRGCRLWRNNVGAAVDTRGVPVRFGLANDSKEMNARVKSSDLIGIGPGGQFIARECKAEDWVYRDTERERAQLKFIEIIIGMGGDACFVTGEGSL